MTLFSFLIVFNSFWCGLSCCKRAVQVWLIRVSSSFFSYTSV